MLKNFHITILYEFIYVVNKYNFHCESKNVTKLKNKRLQQDLLQNIWDSTLSMHDRSHDRNR